MRRRRKRRDGGALLISVVAVGGILVLLVVSLVALSLPLLHLLLLVRSVRQHLTNREESVIFPKP